MKVMVKDLKPKQFVTSFFLLGSFELRRTKNGREFLLLRLSDRTGSILGFIWKNPALVLHILRENSIVKLMGVTRQMNGALGLDVYRIRRAEREEVNLGDYLGVVPEGISYWYGRLIEAVREIRDRYCRGLIDSFLGDEVFMRPFKVCPGGVSYHHHYRGGLLEHTVMTMRQAVLLSGRLSEIIDRDLLMTGCFLHDIGKTRELTAGLAREYTTEGRLLGHILLGLLMLEERLGRMGGFPEDLSLHLRHMILSHHGHPEHGSPIRPLTPEAVVLHLIEGNDAAINHLCLHLKGLGKDQVWSPYDRFLKTELYLKKFKRCETPGRRPPFPPNG